MGSSQSAAAQALVVQISEPSEHVHVSQGSSGLVQDSPLLYGSPSGVVLAQSLASSARIAGWMDVFKKKIV